MTNRKRTKGQQHSANHIAQNTNDRATRTPRKPGVKLGAVEG